MPVIEITTELNLSELFTQFPTVIEDIVLNAGYFLRDDIVGEAPVDTGLLAGSFDYRILNEGLTFQVFSPVKYAKYVATGTQPHFPPWEPIDEWANKHHLPTFPIWYGIGVHGTRPNPYPERAIKKLEENLDSIIQTVLATWGFK